jgi:hypothetical protein
MNVVPGLTAHYRAHAKKSLRAALTNSHRYVLQNGYEKDDAHTHTEQVCPALLGGQARGWSDALCTDGFI